MCFLSSSFVISEIAFFEKWWNEQTLSTQNIVRKLVFKGQLHFVGGGYTQNDEATTHYTAIIDNLALGFYFIKKHFGKYTLAKKCDYVYDLICNCGRLSKTILFGHKVSGVFCDHHLT